MNHENKIFSITIVAFLIIVIIGIVASNADAINSPITSIHKFHGRLKGPYISVYDETGKPNSSVIAVQNGSTCDVVIGRKVGGKVEWAKWVQPGDVWVASEEEISQFCERN